MKRMVILAVLSCLASALLAGGASAATVRAADGCACHTAVPPTGGAPAAHAPLVVPVSDCTTCHVGWTVPHPASVTPRMRLFAAPYVKLSGQLRKPAGNGGYDGVTVYLQQRETGAIGFTDLMTVKTHSVKANLLTFQGVFTAALASPSWGASYRAVSQGVAGPPVVMPGLFPEVLLTPEFAGLHFRGPDKNSVLRLGRSLRAAGSIKPGAQLAGENLTFSLRRMTSRGWKVKEVLERAIRSDGSFSCRFTPTRRGTWEVYVDLKATSEHEEALRGFPHHVSVR